MPRLDDHDAPGKRTQPFAVGDRFTARRGEHPPIDQLMAGVLRHLHRHVPHICKHLRRGGPAWICGQHPAAGILCTPCSVAHVGRHAFDVEHRCDGCGATDDDEGFMIFTAPLHGWTPARNPTRGLRLIVGTVTVQSMGLCRACYVGERMTA
jgi:hypothetical protein